MSFQENLRKFLKLKGLTQKEVATRMSYSTASLNQYLRDRDPNFEFIIKLIEVFPEIDLNELFKSSSINYVQEPSTIYSSEVSKIINELENKLEELKKELLRS